MAMETNITIKFTIQNSNYSDYEEVLQEFLNNLSEIGYDDVDVTEE